MIIAGGQILKMAVTHFVDVSEEIMVSQQILTTVITRSVVDKSTDCNVVALDSNKQV